MASLRDVRLGSSSQGTKAMVERNGQLLLEGNGVYMVDAMVYFGSELTNMVTETIVLTQNPENYRQCTCEPVQSESFVEITGSTVLNADHEVRLAFAPHPVINADHCIAQQHAELFWGKSRILQAPPGAHCAIEGHSEFVTDTAGVYRVRTEYFFGMWMCYSIDEFEITEEA